MIWGLLEKGHPKKPGFNTKMDIHKLNDLRSPYFRKAPCTDTSGETLVKKTNILIDQFGSSSQVKE